MFLEVFEEKRRIGEVQFIGDFLDAQITVFQHLLGFKDDVLVNPLRGGETAGLFHNLRKILRRDAKLIGLEPHPALCAVVLGNQFQELLEKQLVSCGERLLPVALFHYPFVDETAKEIKNR